MPLNFLEGPKGLDNTILLIYLNYVPSGKCLCTVSP